MLYCLRRALAELLLGFAFPVHLRRKLRTTNLIGVALWKLAAGTIPSRVFCDAEAGSNHLLHFL